MQKDEDSSGRSRRGGVGWDRLGAWLVHWSFWPVYLSLLLAFIFWMGPWRKWAGLGEGWERQPRHYLRLYGPVEPDGPLTRVPRVAIGSVILMRGALAPGDEWMLCNGQTLDRTAYPELARILDSRVDAGRTVATLPDWSTLGMTFDPEEAEQRYACLRLRSSESSDEPIHFWIRAR
ncbi:MAG: phage tail protein [bacterium]|nr:phage tail protein [bacterium]